ncbi:hypothetical protein [Chryseobacterium potabilaquae]|uniref:Uncharacterized protein n=1 Tax=Chryseobacterium potabilaquae TaxID=2675057 RepID=A0A6N4X5B2_9FLAO|nr:hypothetical protein [Chryseobacterium potabilaquae]CAA7196199.1 hypothetical protein CHRY9293_02319 [Chryseobacterium potabilaquae]
MATYESLIKLKGTVGDLVFYELNGKNVVRKKSGFNKKAFKKNPSYEKVRQNSSEFGHCSKVGKIIRQALSKYIKEAKDPLLYQRFTKLMTQIKDLDTISNRGKRTVKNGLTTEVGKELLRNFNFGNIPNDKISFIQKNQLETSTFQYDYIIILTLKIDFEHYLSEVHEERLASDKNPQLSFQNHFKEEDFLLYFVVLEKNGEIKSIGFI